MSGFGFLLTLFCFDTYTSQERPSLSWPAATRLRAVSCIIIKEKEERERERREGEKGYTCAQLETWCCVAVARSGTQSGAGRWTAGSFARAIDGAILTRLPLGDVEIVALRLRARHGGF